METGHQEVTSHSNQFHIAENMDGVISITISKEYTKYREVKRKEKILEMSSLKKNDLNNDSVFS